METGRIPLPGCRPTYKPVSGSRRLHRAGEPPAAALGCPKLLPGGRMTQPFDVQPLPASFGAVVTGVRLAQISEPAFAALYAAWLEHALLILPGQHLALDE